MTPVKINTEAFDNAMSKFELPRRRVKNNERNKLCRCGSGKKFKKCCIGTIEKRG